MHRIIPHCRWARPQAASFSSAPISISNLPCFSPQHFCAHTQDRLALWCGHLLRMICFNNNTWLCPRLKSFYAQWFRPLHASHTQTFIWIFTCFVLAHGFADKTVSCLIWLQACCSGSEMCWLTAPFLRTDDWSIAPSVFHLHKIFPLSNNW